MTAKIGFPYSRTAVEEVVVTITVILTVDGEYPSSRLPRHGVAEVVSSHEDIVLPVLQDAAQVAQAVVVVIAIEVGLGVNVEQVVKVDFIGILILLVVEVELVCHLVREVECFCLCAGERHCSGTHLGSHHKHQGEDNLFHSSMVFLIVDAAKVGIKKKEAEGIFPKERRKKPIIIHNA